jgi:Malonyl-CoA decarboxylase C-terminal domain
MLYTIDTVHDPLITLLADDPVRPEIPAAFRISETSEIFVLRHNDTHEPEAVVCVCYKDFTPADILELARDPEGEVNTAVFYTIWSYRPGAGRKLITQAVTHIRRARPQITEFVTLSPPTDMARVFHTRNGAREWRVNGDTVNYLYSTGRAI